MPQILKGKGKLFGLRSLTINNVNKGIIMGDLNFHLTDGEKYGGLTPDQESKLDLSNFIHDLAVMDVDLLGGRFTWSNRRVGGECIQVHLDKSLISSRWLQSHSCRLSLLPEWVQTILLFLSLFAL